MSLLGLVYDFIQKLILKLHYEINPILERKDSLQSFLIKEFIISWESPSSIISLIFHTNISNAKKWLPLINCFSSAPSGAFSFLLIAATSSPNWSLMMMPIPTSRKAEKTAATASTTGNAEIMRDFISSTVQYYLHTTSIHHFLLHFCSTIYIAQATMTIVSSTPSSHCLLLKSSATTDQ